MRSGARFALAAALLGAVVLAGCSAGDNAASSEYSDDSDGAYAEDYDEAGYEAPGYDEVGSSVADAGARMVVQTGWISITSSDPVAAADSVVAKVLAAGGRTDSRSVIAASEYQSPSATLMIRVPSAQVDDVLGKIAEEGELVQSEISAEDVTLSAQDLDARIEAKELSVERLSDLLAQATTNEDIISAEQTLTDRQAELEQLRAERAWLAEQVSLSTVTVEIRVPEEAEAPPNYGFGAGLANGWATMVTAATMALAIIGFVLPWLVVIGTGAAIVMLTVRRRRVSHAEQQTPTPAATEESADAEAVDPAGSETTASAQAEN